MDKEISWHFFLFSPFQLLCFPSGPRSFLLTPSPAPPPAAVPPPSPGWGGLVLLPALVWGGLFPPPPQPPPNSCMWPASLYKNTSLFRAQQHNTECVQWVYLVDDARAGFPEADAVFGRGAPEEVVNLPVQFLGAREVNWASDAFTGIDGLRLD